MENFHSKFVTNGNAIVNLPHSAFTLPGETPPPKQRFLTYHAIAQKYALACGATRNSTVILVFSLDSACHGDEKASPKKR